VVVAGMDTRLDAPVLFEERRADNGSCIGIARLNAPGTLNALSLDMIERLDERLLAWARQRSIAIVVLEAAGDKAFCAGGDLQRLYRSMLEHHASSARDEVLGNDYALRFFAREYRLDYRIHSYPKPVLCWGHGIVMGGGLGLMAGASHRVVTERSRLAMPEISVGIYPDVGGTWLLGRMPGKLGLFLALTGAPLDASDALFAGIADHAIAHAERERVYQRLLRQPWSGARREDCASLTGLLREFRMAPEAVGPARRNFDRIGELCGHGSLAEIAAAITGCRDDDPWLTNAAAALAAGAPGSAALAHELRSRSRLLSLAGVFRMELVVSLHCAARPDFAEGIRALLIDKDRRPRWSHATLADVSADWIDRCFVSPWAAGQHPLADLDNEEGYS
jgi:enoyl-CoA hydratase/carnithine racemase